MGIPAEPVEVASREAGIARRPWTAGKNLGPESQLAARVVELKGEVRRYRIAFWIAVTCSATLYGVIIAVAIVQKS